MSPEVPAGSVVPVFTSGVVRGSVVEGGFVPERGEFDYCLDFRMPGAGYYGVVAVDGRMNPPVRPGDMVIACPEVALSPSTPVVAKLRSGAEVVMGTCHWVSKEVVRLVASNHNFAPVEVHVDELDWIHATVITVPEHELKRGWRRRPPSDRPDGA